MLFGFGDYRRASGDEWFENANGGESRCARLKIQLEFCPSSAILAPRIDDPSQENKTEKENRAEYTHNHGHGIRAGVYQDGCERANNAGEKCSRDSANGENKKHKHDLE